MYKYWKIITSNIRYYKFSTIIIIILLTVTSSLYVVSRICTNSFKDGVKNVTNKLGADIIVASSDYQEEMKNSLFMGEPSTITFSKDIVSDIEKIDGIEKVTSQLLLSTLFDECCDAEIQFISFNEESDFIIRPWIDNSYRKLANNEIIVGSDINYNIGGKAKFYGKIFNVVGKLRKTGMGYDRSIFINVDLGNELLSSISENSVQDQVSMILIDVKKDVNLDEITTNVNRIVNKNRLKAFKSNEIYEEIIIGIGKIENSLNIFIIIIMVISTLSIFSIVTITINQRRKEFAAMEIIGIRDRMKAIIVWMEILSISIIGSIIGSLLSISLIYLFRNYMENIFKIPFIIPTVNEFNIYSIQSLLLAVIVGSISSFYSTCKVYKTSYNKLKEGF